MPITDAPKCQHQQQDGTRCQRPARRRLRLCDFHHREHKRNARRISERARQRWFDSVALDDPKSIQKALARVMQRLLLGEIDHDRAAQLLQKLQMASLDLSPRLSGRCEGVTDQISDRRSLPCKLTHLPVVSARGELFYDLAQFLWPIGPQTGHDPIK
jgi:hypothetical protein